MTGADNKVVELLKQYDYDLGVSSQMVDDYLGQAFLLFSGRSLGLNILKKGGAGARKKPFFV
ncbi:MAG: hypothetical protein KJ732_08045 [Candidatus Margulisbacteria bacterium]|nr:hypothetical protein [Candidatus Margulisiibacteriota bacterium]